MRPEFLKQVRLYLVGSLISVLLIQCKTPLKVTTTSDKTYDSLKQKTGLDPVPRRWKSWNVLLKPGTSSQGALSAVQSVERYILDFLHGVDPTYTATFDIFYCPCDSLLYNIGATALDGTGTAVIPPSGGPNPPIPSGDILHVSINNAISEDQRQRPYGIDSTKKVKLSFPSVAADKVMAVMDTGIDSTLFTGQFSDIIWRPPAGTLALFNFIENDRTKWANYFDDHVDKHGTGVASIAMTAMGAGSYPRVMILKVLNSRKSGSTFTLSCALSYAIQNHANVVNASLGFYEHTSRVDAVLREYLLKCVPSNVYVFAAAGNLPEPHTNNLCDHGTASQNELRSGRLFYPACFSNRIKNVITISGITDLTSPCFYQNCSKKFVNVGVLNNPGCCKYFLPFMNAGYEGSSFSTPAAVGMTMRRFVDGAVDIPASLNSIIQTASSLKNSTRKGRYITYTFNPPGF